MKKVTPVTKEERIPVLRQLIQMYKRGKVSFAGMYKEMKRFPVVREGYSIKCTADDIRKCKVLVTLQRAERGLAI